MSKIFVLVRDTNTICFNIIKESNKKILSSYGYMPEPDGQYKIYLLGSNGFDIQKTNVFEKDVWNVLLDEAGSVIERKAFSPTNPNGIYMITESFKDINKANASDKFSQKLNKTNPLIPTERKITETMTEDEKSVIDFLNKDLNDEIIEVNKEKIEENKKTKQVENVEAKKIIKEETEKRNKKQTKRSK